MTNNSRLTSVLIVIVIAGAAAWFGPRFSGRAGGEGLGPEGCGGEEVIDPQFTDGRDPLPGEIKPAAPKIVAIRKGVQTARGVAFGGMEPAKIEEMMKSAPEALVRRDLATSFELGVEPPRGLYVVQFTGPIEDEQLAALAETGVEIMSYVPENGYVVRAEADAAKKLLAFHQEHRSVELVGDYEPIFRLSPTLRQIVVAPKGTVDVTIQVIDGAEAADTLSTIVGMAVKSSEPRVVGPYQNIDVTIDAGLVADLAQLPDVFAIEERSAISRHNERPDMIIAGNNVPNLPNAGTYDPWLNSKGFNELQFDSFVVNVVDDAYSISGHPDLPATRIAFQNNPTNQSGLQTGHGFFNAQLIGAKWSNDFPVGADGWSYKYGFGVAPWVRLGSTAIYGGGSSTPTAWEATAYGQGARISNNSWGYSAAYSYTTVAQEVDRIVRDAQSATAGNQQLIMLFSAGNNSVANTITAPGTAKNVITIGGSENIDATGGDGCAIPDTQADSANDIASYSSRGPVNAGGGDGRIKPDLVAPSSHLIAGIPQVNYDGAGVCNKYWPAGETRYALSSGVSHATALASGAAALLYQDFLNHARPPPSPAMTKAYLMNSATYMTGAGANDTLPSNNQGMGRLDLGRGLDGVQRVFVDQSTIFGATGATYTINGSIVAADKPFRVTLAWTDAPGPTTGAPWVNNLDLEVSTGGVGFKGNCFNGPSSGLGCPLDYKNNVESVFIQAGSTGQFSVTVRAANIAGDGVPGNGDATDQDFALVLYNATVSPPSGPTIAVSPTSLSFSGTAGGANPGFQSVTVSNGGDGALSFTATDDQPWLSVSPSSGGSGTVLLVSANTSGLAAGTYNGTITLSAAGASNSPVTIPVTLTLIGDPSPTIGVSPTSFSFSGTAGGANPSSQTLSISNTGGGTLTFSASDNQSWLSVSPASGTAPASMTVSVNTAGLAAGSYNGTITISGTGATNTPVNLPVTLTVNAAAVPPTIGVSPSSFSFSASAGGANPANQTLNISNTGGGTLTFTASDNATWLSVSPTSGSAPASVTLSANIAGLAAGTYNGTITISATGASNTPTSIPVTLTVNAPPSGNLIANGGFEGSSSPWVLSGDAYYVSNGSYPHGGSGYAYAGYYNSAAGQLYQTITIPSSATTANLTFWLNVQSSETTTTTQYDKLFAEVRNTSGTLLATLGIYSNLSKAAAGVYSQKGAFSLLNYKGQTIRLQFRATTDASNTTTFRIDDVAVQ